MAGSDFWSVSTLLGFLLTLMRIGGVFVFVPVPGFKSAVDPARVVLIGAMTIALAPVWPHPPADTSAGLFVLWMMSEAALGVGIGLAVAFALEAFVMGAQMIGLQAGFSFASTVDPFTQADSTVLIILAQTAAALLFFASGLDREVLRIFAQSLVTYPPGTFVLTKKATDIVLMAGSAMFSAGLRLALPITAAMLMVDIALALLGRINSQLQLLTIAFPVKIVLSLVLLGWLVIMLPALLRGGAGITFAAARALITR
ncbi:MAG TPA: flagellar biosynthetic protein FliR [Bryobacteraceae bacterium]|nr:flagellar biosynthetic protein FliR [Bryobacteraceae bacterium]